MLILTRRAGESLKIGDEVTVTVLGLKGPQVRLGFAAPKHVAVHREEIYKHIQAGTRTDISSADDRRGQRAHDAPSRLGVLGGC